MHYNTNKCSTENQLWPRALATRRRCMNLARAKRHASKQRENVRTYWMYANVRTTRTNERKTADATPKCKHKSQRQVTSSACKHANVQESHNTFFSTVHSQGHESLDTIQDTLSTTSNWSEINIEKHIMELCTTSRAKRQVLFSPHLLTAHQMQVSNLYLKR